MARKKEIARILLFLVFLSVVLSIFTLFPLVLAEPFNYNEAIQSQVTHLEISNKIYSTSQKLEANLSLFPLDDERQTANSISAQHPELSAQLPEAQPTPSGILFNFNQKGNLEFKLESNVTSRLLIEHLESQDLNGLKNENFSKEIFQYTKPSKFIDSDSPIIMSKAQQLVEEKNNSVEALYILAEYVKNSMTYDLDSSDLKKSSEIIQKKRGVCAQYTILFVSLCRALGIPARYVSGIAYSNQAEEFQEHAWAEVYLPDQGWIPFDVTFGQYGWLDSSHIALKKGTDAGESSVKYSYVGGYIQPEQLSINSTVFDYQESKNFSNISLELEPYKEKIGQGSYLPLKVRVKNNNPYYLMLPIRISIAPEVYGKSQKIILLAPLEEKEFYFTIYFPYEQECRYGCISKIQVQDSFQDQAEINVTFSDSYQQISLDKANSIMNQSPNQETGDFDFYCTPEKDLYSKNEEKRAICTIKSAKSEYLKLCSQAECLEKFFEKDKQVQEQINVSQDETNACFKLSNTNFSLNSRVLFKTKEANFFEKIWNEIRNFFQKSLRLWHISNFS